MRSGGLWICALLAVGCGASESEQGPSGDGSQELATGDYHTCKLTAAGALYCWGTNDTLQLGRGTDGRTVGAVEGIQGVTHATGGTYHSCATTADGGVWCWGRNHRGQLGDGTITVEPRQTPSRVAGLTNAVEIDAGGDFTCSRLADASVHCWGGVPGAAQDQPTAAKIDGLPDAAQVAAGTNHACVLAVDGTVYCWGANGFGQLGDDAFGDASSSPVQVPGVSGAVRISAGGFHNCVVTQGGALQCWGQNLYGQLAHDNSTDHAVSTILLAPVADVSGGHSHTCAVLVDGTAQCWGANDDGQLGDGTTTTRSAPATTTLPSAVLASELAVRHSCAMLQGGEVYCWGDGNLAGTGLSSSLTPVRIVGLPPG